MPAQQADESRVEEFLTFSRPQVLKSSCGLQARKRRILSGFKKELRGVVYDLGLVF